MKVFVSIATMNSRERLRACLSSLASACEGLEWSATVVDNCTHDGTREMLQEHFPSVDVIVNRTIRGFGANHNEVLGAVLARAGDTDHVLILNDDTYLYPRSVTELVRCATEDVATGVVSPLVVSPRGEIEPTGFKNTSQRAFVFASFVGWPRVDRPVAEYPDWLNGCCLLIPVMIIRRVGLFDERFYMFSEDVDLTTRVREAGYTLRICNSSRIMHYGHGTVSQSSLSMQMQRQMYRSYYLYLRKHRGRYTAGIVSCALRIAHATRGSAMIVVGRAARDEARRAEGKTKLLLARYSPREPVFAGGERFS
jgi:hypothetical protein